VESAAALEWVLAKLSARNAALPKAPTYKPPEFKPAAPAAPAVAPRQVETPAEKARRLEALRPKEVRLWEKWIQGGKKPDDFEELKRSHMPLINKRLSQFRGAEVNRVAMKAVAMELYYKQLETWNPKHPSGASLTTHIHNGLRGLKRFVVKHQNPLRITEPMSEKITPYKSAVEELKGRLGYEPTDQQIVEHTLKWDGPKLSMKDVRDVQKQVKPSYFIEAGGEPTEGAGHHTADPYMQAAFVIKDSLRPHEVKVFDLMFPVSGRKPVVKSGAIANRLKWEVSKVSKAKGAILNKIREHVGE
jgi:hypothetical protein